MEYACIALAAALSVGLTGLATAMAQARIGSAGAGAIAENPKVLGAVIVLVAIPETMVILGFVIAFMLMSKL
ncbi:MAG: ATPase [Planctomycetes bacterium]|nr:ATPase [Planctomycetota bacterium]